ncbi:LysR substrate binding domain protein [Mitsuokella sp. oral taxon 131 str. W9106]|nr:LysR substrate binding domain protein [Mitsuokella sp. oral taxon 131 str. W9106]
MGDEMEFRQLEYFCMISELENFTRTAEVLHVSQPSVTKAIKALEAELGLMLIDRSQKHVELTEEGRAFLVHAKRIMRDADEAKRDMMRFRHDCSGTVRFGIPPMVEAYLFPDLFVKFRAAFPDIHLDVQEFGDSDEVRQRADIGELDFGIVLGNPAEQWEHSMAIMHDTMRLCLAPNHPLAGQDEIRFSDLKEEKFILQQPRTYQYRETFSRCTEQGFTPEIVLSTSQTKTIKQLVVSAMGISVLPDFVVHADRSMVRKKLVPPMELAVFLYWNGHKRSSAVDDRFMHFIQDYTSSPEYKQHFRQV